MYPWYIQIGVGVLSSLIAAVIINFTVWVWKGRGLLGRLEKFEKIKKAVKKVATEKVNEEDVMPKGKGHVTTSAIKHDF